MTKKKCNCKCGSRRDRSEEEYKKALKKMYDENKKKNIIYENEDDWHSDIGKF